MKFTGSVSSVDETLELAQKIGSMLNAGSVLTLDGDLAAGKTTFTKGLAVGLGIDDVINSPTFTIIKEYEGSGHDLYHMDVYRLETSSDVDFIEDYFYRDGVCVIEWSSIIRDVLPKERLEIRISNSGDNDRVIEFVAHGDGYGFLSEICNY